MTISKTKAEDISSELKPLIAEVLKRHGMDAKFAWKYGAWFELKVTASAVEEGANGVNLGSPEAQYFTRFGFSALAMTASGAYTDVKLEAPLGTLFVSRGTTYAFAGIASKRKKYPIYAINISDGTATFFTEHVVATINSAAASAAV